MGQELLHAKHILGGLEDNVSHGLRVATKNQGCPTAPRVSRDKRRPSARSLCAEFTTLLLGTSTEDEITFSHSTEDEATWSHSTEDEATLSHSLSRNDRTLGLDKP